MDTVRATPQQADWYAEVIIGKDGEDTTYNYDYYAGGAPTAAFLQSELVPEGWTMLERTVRRTRRA